MAHKTTGSKVNDYIRQLKEAKMEVFLHVKCWHQETRTRSTGSGENRSTETYHVDVTTFSQTVPFNYEECQDHSKSRINFSNFSVVRVNSDVSHAMGDAATTNLFLNMKTTLFESNKHRDSSCAVDEQFGLPGVVQSQLVVDEGGASFLLQKKWMYLSALFCVGWAYHIWFQRTAGEVNFRFSKKLFLQRQADGSHNPVDEEIVCVQAFPAGGGRGGYEKPMAMAQQVPVPPPFGMASAMETGNAGQHVSPMAAPVYGAPPGRGAVDTTGMSALDAAKARAKACL